MKYSFKKSFPRLSSISFIQIYETVLMVGLYTFLLCTLIGCYFQDKISLWEIPLLAFPSGAWVYSTLCDIFPNYDDLEALLDLDYSILSTNQSPSPETPEKLDANNKDQQGD